MKVFFVGSEFLGRYYVRCFLPLLANGWRGNYSGLTTKAIKSANLCMREMMDSDIIVFHRANTPEHHKVGMVLKAAGKKIVFDNHDTFQLDDTNAFYKLDSRGFEENKEKIRMLYIALFAILTSLLLVPRFLPRSIRKSWVGTVIIPLLLYCLITLILLIWVYH